MGALPESSRARGPASDGVKGSEDEVPVIVKQLATRIRTVASEPMTSSAPRARPPEAAKARAPRATA
jgi:hypothetical protein